MSEPLRFRMMGSGTDGFNQNPFASELSNTLVSKRFGRPFLFRDEVDSTNNVARSWAQAGVPEGGVVFAEYQSAGKGRLGRRWTADPGKNIMFSIILRPTFGLEWFGWIALAAGLALAKTSRLFLPDAEIRVKWPNDLMINGKKGAGILSEAESGPANLVILGIGVNVNQDTFPAGLDDKATSLKRVLGEDIPRALFLARLLENLEVNYDGMTGDGPDFLRDEYVRLLAGLGKEVTVRSSETETVTGILAGVDGFGALNVTVGNTTRTFFAGDVTLDRNRNSPE